MESRCRLCAEYYIEQIPILEQLNLDEKIFQLFHLKIQNDDRLPLTVCTLCYDIVEKSWDFYDRIQKAQELLSELCDTLDIVPAELTYDTANIKCDFNDGTELLIVKADDLPLDIPENVESDKKEKKKKKDNLELDFDFKINSDGSISPTIEVSGWESYPWSCAECQELFISSEDLRDHVTTVHSTLPKYVCADCPKMYSKFHTFLVHVKVHRVKLKYNCDICYKWFPSITEQLKHRSIHEKTGPYSCKQCGKTYSLLTTLKLHMHTHQQGIEYCYQCSLCHKKFATKPNLTAHKRIHSGIRNFTCDQCGKSFVQKGNLDNHLLTHTAARPFSCNTCGKTFKTLMRLRKHDSVHSGLKPFRCEICGRGFRERGTLKEHERIHTGAMPFTCEYCGKSFRFKGVLTTHRRQHTGERPYSCNECQHHFTNWPNYNKHMKRRHGINTSVNCRTRQDIPPTGMPHRNPPGTVLAAPQPVVAEPFLEQQPTFYPVLNLFNISEELLQQRV